MAQLNVPYFTPYLTTRSLIIQKEQTLLTNYKSAQQYEFTSSKYISSYFIYGV